MQRELDLLKSITIAAGCLSLLVGCGTEPASDDYSAEFAGTYHVTERSTEKLLPIDSVRLTTTPTGSAS
jgi:hypothetical protein